MAGVKVSERNAQDVASALVIARDAREHGQLARADAVLRMILVTHPDHPEALHECGLVALQGGQGELAASLLEGAIALKADVWYFHSNLGVAYRTIGRLDSALAAYREALRLAPHSPAGYFNVGNLLRQQGKPAEAMEHYRQALAISAGYQAPRLALGELLAEAGDHEEARRCLSAIPPDAPEAAAAARLLAGFKK